MNDRGTYVKIGLSSITFQIGYKSSMFDEYSRCVLEMLFSVSYGVGSWYIKCLKRWVDSKLLTYYTKYWKWLNHVVYWKGNENISLIFLIILKRGGAIQYKDVVDPVNKFLSSRFHWELRDFLVHVLGNSVLKLKRDPYGSPLISVVLGLLQIITSCVLCKKSLDTM